MQNNLGLFLTKRAFMTPDREGYVDGGGAGRYTFRELNERCNQMANALLGAGVQEGERVGLLLMNSVEFMESYFALSKIGAVVVPLNWRLVADELEFILKDSGTRRLIYGEEFVELVAELHSRGTKTDITHWIQVGQTEAAFFADAYDPFRTSGDVAEPTPRGADDDMLYIMYTSGTTGLPKGVVHTHNTAIWALITIAATTSFADGEIYLAPLPMFHVGALTPLAVNVYAGATSVVMRSFDPVRAWQLIEQEKITTGLAVPAMLNFMLQVPNPGQYDHSSLKWVMTGAAPVPVSLLEAYRKLG
ncbi:MAG: AMP-binding protein, partial [Proteobacteria bacterium]|nr:AMP-binding protein [Pseudomonadota bacterium]